MQVLEKEMWRHGGSVLQAEDEIAGIGAAIGASFAGTKAMTATSGPGLSLKTEMLGLASAAEAAVGLRQRPARRTLDRNADEARAVRPVRGGLFRPWRQREADPRADGRGRHLRRDGRGIQHRGGLPDPGHRPLRPGNRPAQGGDRADRHQGPRTRRQARADRGGAGVVHPVQDDAVGREPDQPSGDGGGRLPRGRDRARQGGLPQRQRRKPHPDEREAAPEARPAQTAPRPLRIRG